MKKAGELWRDDRPVAKVVPKRLPSTSFGSDFISCSHVFMLKRLRPSEMVSKTLQPHSIRRKMNQHLLGLLLTISHRLKHVVLFLSATVAMAWVGFGQASADYSNFNIDLNEAGPNVVATGSGSINTSVLGAYMLGTVPEGPGGSASGLSAGDATGYATLFLGYENSAFQVYKPTVTGPTNFGSGGQEYATTSSGDVFLIGYFSGDLSGDPYSIGVPQGYTSDAPLSNSTTWDNATLSSLGVSPGSYTWTWGSPSDGGSITLNATPEPSSFYLALATVGLIAWRRFFGQVS